MTLDPVLRSAITPHAALRAWMVNAWRTVRWTPPADPTADTWKRWRHLRTLVLDGGGDSLARGEAIWVLDDGCEPVGAAWEWVEWQPGVIILNDPMSIVSNLTRAVEEDDDAPPMSRDMILNTIAHTLPWQDKVTRVIEGLKSPARPTRRALDAPARLAA